MKAGFIVLVHVGIFSLMSMVAFLHHFFIVKPFFFCRFKRAVLGLRLYPTLFLLFVFSLLVMLSVKVAANAAPPIPPLPTEWKSLVKGDQYLLVDFYADYCGTCKMMFPHLKKLEKQFKDSLVIKHVNITHPSPKSVANRFQVSSTPTYVLYQPDGQPAYRMIDLIAPTVLERQVKRAMGQLNTVTFPAGTTLPAPLEHRSNSWGNLILLAFETPDCQLCQNMRPQLDAFAEAGKMNGLTVFHIDAKKSPAWVAAANLESYPTYVLLDNSKQGARSPSYGELFRATGETDPQLLWQSITMFSESGLDAKP